MMRFVLNLDSRVQIGPSHFKSVNLLPVCKRVEHIILCYVFKVVNQMAPEYLSDCFVSQESIHSYCTRLCKKEDIVFLRLNVLCQSLLVSLVLNYGAVLQLV
jgi:hypothetical protein